MKIDNKISFDFSTGAASRWFTCNNGETNWHVTDSTTQKDHRATHIIEKDTNDTSEVTGNLIRFNQFEKDFKVKVIFLLSF